MRAFNIFYQKNIIYFFTHAVMYQSTTVSWVMTSHLSLHGAKKVKLKYSNEFEKNQKNPILELEICLVLKMILRNFSVPDSKKENL